MADPNHSGVWKGELKKTLMGLYSFLRVIKKKERVETAEDRIENTIDEVNYSK